MKKFEERLERLEEIADSIRGEVPVENAMALFEEGVKLAKGLEKDLEKIEGRIEILLNEPEKPASKGGKKPEAGLFDEEE